MTVSYSTETFMKTMKAIGAVALLAGVLAAVGGCESSDCSGQGQTTAKQDKADKPSGIPKELTLDLGNKVTMKLVLIPAGKFLLGSPEGEKGRQGYAEPQREVTISKPFYVGVYEVTQEQYEQVMGKNPSKFKGAKNPVETASWEDAVLFCKVLSDKTSKTVSLPTEVQWEYACRAGSKTRFCFGDDDSGFGGYAWYRSNSDSKTHPVGGKKSNAFGLYDMHGNVWEWCSDWWAASYAKAKNRDPLGPDSGTARVLRGGCWINDPKFCMSASRYGGYPVDRSSNSGFRVTVLVADVDSPSPQPATQPSTRPAKALTKPALETIGPQFWKYDLSHYTRVDSDIVNGRGGRWISVGYQRKPKAVVTRGERKTGHNYFICFIAK